MNSGGNAHFCRHTYNGTAYVTAEAYNNIRLEALDDFSYSSSAGKKIPNGFDISYNIFRCELTLKA